MKRGSHSARSSRLPPGTKSPATATAASPSAPTPSISGPIMWPRQPGSEHERRLAAVFESARLVGTVFGRIPTQDMQLCLEQSRQVASLREGVGVRIAAEEELLVVTDHPDGQRVPLRDGHDRVGLLQLTPHQVERTAWGGRLRDREVEYPLRSQCPHNRRPEWRRQQTRGLEHRLRADPPAGGLDAACLSANFVETLLR